jgi:hypothetical protein
MELLVLIIVVLALALILMQVYLQRRKGKWSDSDMKFCRKSWQKIVSEKDLRHQIQDADKLLDHMLRKKGFKGSLGEVLKRNASIFSDINGLWYAHKMRNKLAHELEYKVNSRDVNMALRSFKRALKDIGLNM